jgi:excisionase family DNA binding protein
LEPLLLKATEAGKLLGLGRSKVFAMVAAGELPVIRIGRSVRIPRQALERWIRNQTIEVGQRSESFIGNAMKYHL